MLTIGASLNSFSQDAEAIKSLEKKANSLPPTEYVLEIPLMETQKVLPIFKQAFKQFSGVEFKGFCESRRLLFFKANTVGYQEMINYLHEMKFEYFEKTETNHQRAMNSCSSISEIESTIAID